jgi:pyruvate dehydrogenase E1 component alpha subunit
MSGQIFAGIKNFILKFGRSVSPELAVEKVAVQTEEAMLQSRVPQAVNRITKQTAKRAFSSFKEVHEFDLDVEWKTHRCDAPPTRTSFTRDEGLKWLEDMQYIRRIEILSDNYYKKKMIRGFCHLYDGQEAVCVGIEAGSTKNDHMITTYRDHGWQFTRGDTVRSIMAEQFGKDTGCSRGKGGSMHLYYPEGRFYGGNGIVGAQCPVGAGIAFACKYNNKQEVVFTMYGDGAANQGQLYEVFNMCALWKLPCIFVCENNEYGMGTSTERHAFNNEFYQRGDYVPGIQVDGMNVFTVREATKYARQHCLDGKGPIVMEVKTYRYHGHSMSDPGITYRTREEVSDMRSNRDPIDKLKNMMLKENMASEEEIKAMEKRVRKDVTKQAEQAEKDGELSLEQLYQDIYSTGPPPFIRYANYDESQVRQADGSYKQIQQL